MNLEEKLSKLIEEKKLSTEEIAKELDVSEEQITKWKEGEEKPNTEQIEKLCQILKVEKKELIEQPEIEKEEKIQEKSIENETLNDFKPRKWLLIILIIIALAISVVLINKAIEIRKENQEKKNGIFNQFMDKYNETNEKIETDSFNSNYEFYGGTQSEYGVKSLLDEVITNNKKNKDRIITVVYELHTTTDPEEITTIKNEVTSNKKYEVSFDYGNKQYINKVTITGTIDKDSHEIKSFNNGLEMYSGTKSGFFVSILIDKIVTNNKTNQDHLLTVIYGSRTTTNPEEITTIKKELDEWHDYEVSLDYDENGYANKVTIK